MGREFRGTVHWNGLTAESKVCLESREIILRGAIRARIPRETLSGVDTTAEGLCLTVSGGTLILALAPIEAEKWAQILSNPPPTLAKKLGIDTCRRAYLIGSTSDAALLGSLEGAQARELAQADVILAILEQEHDIEHALEIVKGAPDCPIWCIYPKGRDATITGTQVRGIMRARGYVDNKVSAVSDILTATRYARPGRSAQISRFTG